MVADLHIWDSNHEAFALVGVPTSKRLFFQKNLKYISIICSSKSSSLSHFSYCFTNHSSLYKMTSEFFLDECGIDYFFATLYICALLGQITF